MSRAPLPTEPVEAQIEGFTHGGKGVARVQGKAVFVPHTIPGERVRLQVIDDRKRWARAVLLDVVEPSPDRVVPPCPYVPECGGCDLQHIQPDAQRELKTQVVREQLTRLGGQDDPPVRPTRSVGPDVAYRNNIRLHADEQGRLGFHRTGSHDVVPIDRCLIASEDVQRLREAVGDDTGAAEVTVRAHARTQAAAVRLTPGPGPLDIPDGGFDVALSQPDGSVAVLRGDGELTEMIAGRRFRFDTTSFFQVTTFGAEALTSAVLDAVGDVEGASLWDLYAGVGLLSLPMAAAGAQVVAVEGYPTAAEYARINARENQLELEVVADEVARTVRRAASGGRVTVAQSSTDLELPDIVVLDPPRQGAGKRVITDLARMQPATIVYVACDVAALSRDTRTLSDAGYRLVEAQPLDLFPMTHHVEVVAAFAR